MPTRRSFLATSSMMAAGLGLGARPLFALTDAEWRRPAASWFPPPEEPATHLMLARKAIDAARQAGASFADIRIGDKQGLLMSMAPYAPTASNHLWGGRTYGVRVLVDGVWGFMGGATLTEDRIIAAAREAVMHAKRYAAVRSAGVSIARVELPPVPVVTGEWSPPMEIDPFTVPLDAQREQLGMLTSGISRVLGISPYNSTCMFRWMKDIRVVVSSEGTAVVQHAIRAMQDTKYYPDEEFEGVFLPNYGKLAGGFETVLAPGLMERIKAYADEFARLARLPETTAVDAGRHAIVLEGRVAGQLAGVLLQACNADRALGLDADVGGTTFLAPMDEILRADKPQFAPAVTLRTSPSLQSSLGWKWDDEGVLRTPSPLITEGKVVGYTASREGIAMMTPAQRDAFRGAVLLSGNGTAQSADRMPQAAVVEATLAPAASEASVYDLAREMKEGILIIGEVRVSTDPTLGRSFVTAPFMFHVKGGEPIGRIKNMGLMVQTPRLWKQNLTALGGASSVQTGEVTSWGGMPWQTTNRLVRAPALLATDVDVVRTQGMLGA